MIGAKTGIYSASASGGANLFAGASAAYSLRDLGLGATNAIRVRRSSDDAEEDISLSNFTSALTTFVGAGNGFVTVWYDQSGNSRDMEQSTAGNQPQIVDSGSIITKNGNIAIYSDRKNSNHELVYASPVVNATDTSYFAVASNENLNDFGTLFATNGSSNDDNYRSLVDTRATLPRRNFVISTNPTSYFADLSVSREDTDQRLISGFVDSAKGMSAYDNGQEGTNFDTYVGSFSSNNLTLTPDSATNKLRLETYMSELIFYNSDQSSNRVAIESNINDYYNIF